MKLNEIAEKNHIKKVSCEIETRNRPDGNGTYDMLKMSCSINGRLSSWKLGANKLKTLMYNYDSLITEVESFDFTKGTWRKDFEFQSNNPKFVNKPLKLTINHIVTMYLFKEEIDNFIASRVSKRPRVAIANVQYADWVTGFDVIPVIMLPCFEKQEGDKGDGLIPWTLTIKRVSNMFKYYVFGDEDIDTHFERWMNEHPTEDCIYEGTKQDGTTYQVVFKPEQVKAWVTYSKELAKFERKYK